MKAVRRRLSLWGAEGDAVIVETGHPWRLILWEKAQFVPCWDLGGDVWLDELRLAHRVHALAFSTQCTLIWLHAHACHAPRSG